MRHLVKRMPSSLPKATSPRTSWEKSVQLDAELCEFQRLQRRIRRPENPDGVEGLIIHLAQKGRVAVRQRLGDRGNPLATLAKSGYKSTGLYDTIREGLSDVFREMDTE